MHGAVMSKRKAYRPKPVHMPMMKESRDALAMQLHARVESLILAPSIDSCNEVSKMLATMSHAGLDSAALDAASEAVNAIIDRWERVKRIGVSAQEAEVVRLIAPLTSVILQPLALIHRYV